MSAPTPSGGPTKSPGTGTVGERISRPTRSWNLIPVVTSVAVGPKGKPSDTVVMLFGVGVKTAPYCSTEQQNGPAPTASRIRTRTKRIGPVTGPTKRLADTAMPGVNDAAPVYGMVTSMQD